MTRTLRAARGTAVTAGCAAALVMIFGPRPGAAQMRTPGTGAVSEDVGPIGDPSQPVGAGSRSVHDGSATIGESSEAPGRSGPVRDATTRSMRSGPVSSLSRGSMTQRRLAPNGGSVSEASAGAVKHDIDRPLGSRISQPLRELGALQDQLRRLRQQGDSAAIAASGAPPGDVSGAVMADTFDEPATPFDNLPPAVDEVAPVSGEDGPPADTERSDGTAAEPAVAEEASDADAEP